MMYTTCLLLDGLRPDALALARTPHIDGLIRRGCYTPAARSVMPSMTLPCHQSIFHGVLPGRHGIVSNVFTPFVRPIKGLIQTVHEAGGVCGMFYNWEQLRDVTPPDHLAVSMFVRQRDDDKLWGDAAVADMAAAWLGANAWNFAFVYFEGIDATGHRHGWMSPEYLAAVEHADGCVGRVLAAIGPEATVIVTADHGGHDQTHGTDSPADMTIPFAIAGPGVPAGGAVALPFDLTCIAPTVCASLGLPPNAEWTGTPARFETGG